MPDYSKANTYKIVNDIDDYVYVGTTQKLCKRMVKHREHMKKIIKNSSLCIHMNKYGVSHFQILFIRNVPCKNREETFQEECMEFDKLFVMD